MKRIIALALVAITAVCALAGCSSLKGDEKGANISVYMTSYPYCLDPAVVQLDSEVTQILGLIYEGLTEIDSSGKVVGALAKNWYGYYDKVYDEYQMYFELKDTCWNDGRKVSADQIVYAWKRILDPDFDSPYASLLYPIKNAKAVKSGAMTSDDLGIAAVDDTLLCVTFECDYDISLFAEQIACTGLVPLREDIVTDVEEGVEWDSSAATMACNGPYSVKNLEEGIRVVLERNNGYMRDDEAAIDKYVTPYRITIVYQENTISRSVDEELRKTDIQFQTLRFSEGNLFYMSGFDKDSYAEYEKKLKDTTSLMETYVFYFNTENELLSDKKVRQALSAALDRDYIVENVTGTGEIAATGYVPSGVFNTKRKTDFRKVGGDLYSTSADTAKAESLLGEAGVSKGSFTIAYLIPESEDLMTDNQRRVVYENVFEDIAEYAASVWEELGFSVDTVGLHEAEYRAALQTREYDVIGVCNVENSVDAYAWLSVYATHYSGCPVEVSLTGEDVYTPHYTNWENDEFDSIIDRVCYESDRAARAELLHDAEELLADECPAIALFQYTSSYVKSSKLSGIGQTYYFGYRDFDKLSLSGWRKINAAEEEASNSDGTVSAAE